MGVDYVGRVGPRPAPPEEAERTTGTERPARPRAVEPAGEDRWEGEDRAHSADLPGDERSPEEQEEEREEETAARDEAVEDVADGKAEGEGAEEAEDSEEVEGGEGEGKRGRRLDRRA